jgi:hypothetical protein
MAAVKEKLLIPHGADPLYYDDPSRFSAVARVSRYAFP